MGRPSVAGRPDSRFALDPHQGELNPAVTKRFLWPPILAPDFNRRSKPSLSLVDQVGARRHLPNVSERAAGALVQSHESIVVERDANRAKVAQPRYAERDKRKLHNA